MSDNKKTQKSIPTSKVKRAAKIIGTSAKVGGNYVKYYSKKAFNKNLTKDELHQDNASDIYDTLSELKGSALKVAQMMSMDEQVLPKAYQEKFALSQYSAPALSFPLISKTFKEQLGKSVSEVYDSFTKEAVNAASIGQVHKAELDGKKLAVKVQYPGVADSISSDLRLVKSLAGRLLNMNPRDLKEYVDEVEEKLIEETDYLLELERSNIISKACSSIEGVKFPKYYKYLSARRILTMDWMEGDLLTEYIKTNPSQEKRNQVGQRMWDFFLFQMQELRLMHADPHPGNFIVDKDNNLCVLDFGCVKEINENFADNYFRLLGPNILDDKDKLEQIYINMSFFRPEDKASDKVKLRTAYQEMIGVLALPFHTETFDFGRDDYFKKIFEMGEQFSNDKELRKLNNARGSKDAIYVFRTFFGLYNLLHQLKAEVTLNYKLYESVSAA